MSPPSTNASHSRVYTIQNAIDSTCHQVGQTQMQPLISLPATVGHTQIQPLISLPATVGHSFNDIVHSMYGQTHSRAKSSHRDTCSIFLYIQSNIQKIYREMYR